LRETCSNDGMNSKEPARTVVPATTNSSDNISGKKKAERRREARRKTRIG